MTLKIGILTRSPSSWACRELYRACLEEGAECIFFRFRDLSVKIHGKPIVYLRDTPIENVIDVVFVRPIGKCSLEQAIYRIDILHLLRDLGLRVINDPKSIEIAIDKFRTTYLLSLHGIKTPLTVVTENEYRILDVQYREIFRKRDVVIKPLFGSRGYGIVRVLRRNVKKPEDFVWRLCFYLTACGAVLYIQEYLKTRGQDYRLFVIGDRVVASMIRRAPPGEWRTNVSQGGQPLAVKVSEEVQELAIKAARVIGCEIAGIDIAEVDGEYYVLEINSQPGWRGIQQATGVDIAREIVKYIKETVKR